MMTTAIHKMVEDCRAGAYPALIARMTSGWAILGKSQFLNGYALLLPDPVVPHLNAMNDASRGQFLSDMARLGDAVLAATEATRINYAMLGNLEPALHAHVIPRYANESSDKRTAHPWAYDWNAAPQFDERLHAEVLTAIRSHLRL